MNNAQLLAKLQELITLEPSLFQELKKEKNMEQLVKRMVEAAERHGIAISVDGLSALLATAKAANIGKGEINDEDLEDVTGGLDFDNTAKLLLDFFKPRIEHQFE